eukprot:TRINITY_DN6340_c0_g1_i1.p1 TRINITY_DN6340_c0_g1~~TRINITY_DN6340_c0_g1_i1.p1  ORF type:complete len:275 (+),score=42.76 TRINITY_DN6340_c0_g1_i1:49-825(+)
MAQQEAPAAIVPLRFEGPIPYPHREVTDLTPDQQFDEHTARLEKEQQEKEAVFQGEKKSASSGGGAFGKLSMFAKGVAHNVSKGATQLHSTVESKVRMELKEREGKAFTTSFPAQAGSTYICTYSCRVMHAGAEVSGDLILSSTHLNFLSKAVVESIPLGEIVSIQRSIVLPTVTGGAPYILPVPAEHVIPQCLQIFTSQQKVYQFLEFANTGTSVSTHVTTSVKGNALERCYNFMDHAWRAAVTVPIAGVDYLPPRS